MVAVETPQHSAVGGLLDYLAARRLAPGTLVRVPLGRRMVTGVVWDADGPGQAPAQALRPIAQVLDAVPALPPGWRELVGFAARYYQRGIGELALSVRNKAGVHAAVIGGEADGGGVANSRHRR